MAMLSTLPHELISMICSEDPDSIPNLRLASRRFDAASFDVFKSEV
jgi:hypothetical protein